MPNYRFGKHPPKVDYRTLRFATYAEGYGQFALGRERFQQLTPEHAAVRCDACPGCTVRCPHGVLVAERLIRAQELFTC